MPIDNDVYNRLGATWWDEDQAFYLLRSMLNPARFGYFREILLERLKLDAHGKTALDVGCGGGLLAEEFAQLGLQVTGVDPSEPSIETAQRHAQQAGLDIRYLVGVGETLPFAEASFDIVYCCDVLEHVRDLERVIAEIARVLKPGGIFFYDTINRTFISNIGLIKVLQDWPSTSVLPANLHDWNMFIKPRELRTLLQRHGLVNQEMIGLMPAMNPLKLLLLLRKLKRGQIPLQALNAHVHFRRSRLLLTSYMGYAHRRQKP